METETFDPWITRNIWFQTSREQQPELRELNNQLYEPGIG